MLGGPDDTMGSNELIRCRVAACREGRGKWEFFLINDSAAPLDWAVLKRVGYEWGDWSNHEEGDVRVVGLAPGAHALIWRDDGDGAELRMELTLQVCMGQREGRLVFEFPMLYKQRELPQVEGLGRAGWQTAAVF